MDNFRFSNAEVDLILNYGGVGLYNGIKLISDRKMPNFDTKR
jgi:hypothetical protein